MTSDLQRSTVVNAAGEPTARLRFGLKSLFALIAYAAFVCAWFQWFPHDPSRWQSYFPGSVGMLSVGVLTWSAISSLCSRRSDIDVLVTAWMLAALDIGIGLPMVITTCSLTAPTNANWGRLYRECLPDVWIYSLTLPLVVALPTCYIMISAGRWRSSPATPWLLVASAVALIDLILCGFALYLPFEIAGRLWEQ
jgi:hypothetical protein